MRIRRRWLVVASALAVICLARSNALASAKTQIAREAAEYLLAKFGKEAAEETAETLARRIESLAVKYGDNAVAAVRRVGPRGLRAIEDAGEHSPLALKLLEREGSRALWVVEHPERLSLFARYGDDAAAAMLKHKGVAEPIVAAFREPGAKALRALDTRNARRLAIMSESGELAGIGQTERLMGVIGRFGNRGMDFVWRNKKALVVAAALTAFLTDPQPFIDGTAQLAENFARPVAETIGGEVARRADWTRLGLMALAVLGIYALARFWIRERLRCWVSARRIEPAARAR